MNGTERYKSTKNALYVQRYASWATATLNNNNNKNQAHSLSHCQVTGGHLVSQWKIPLHTFKICINFLKAFWVNLKAF